MSKGAFKGQNLPQKLGIKPLNETPGLQIYGAEDRVWTTPHKDVWQSITVQVHKKAEIDTDAFRDFLTRAAESFFATIKGLQTKPEDLMPWKVDGEKWHLGDKGFPPRKKVLWDRQLLVRMLKLLREIEPELSVSWETRDMITIRVDGVSRAWCFCRTKDAEALDWRFVIKRGAVNLARVEGIGEVEVVSSRADGDVLRVRLKDLNAEQAGRLKEVLAETLEGFREMFAREKAG